MVLSSFFVCHMYMTSWLIIGGIKYKHAKLDICFTTKSSKHDKRPIETIIFLKYKVVEIKVVLGIY